MNDIVVIGAGAAGLMAALAAREALGRAQRGPITGPPIGPAPGVMLVDGAAKIGLKILASGGGRCNVTNENVSERDFSTDAPHLLRNLLRALPVASVREFFDQRGCALYAEPLGKLFPTTNRAAQVLRVLLDATRGAGVSLTAGDEVVAVTHEADRSFHVRCASGRDLAARRVIVATGGKSLPKTGSRGFGYQVAAAFGHDVIAPLPALTPVLLAGDGPLAGLSGITVPALLSLVEQGALPEQVAGKKYHPLARAAGSFLVTHHGASGPAALDVSGACARALADARAVTLLADFWTLTSPQSTYAPFLALEKAPGASLAAEQTPRPTSADEFAGELRQLGNGVVTFAGVLEQRLPKRLVDRLLRVHGVGPGRRVKEASADEMQRAWRAVVHCDLRLRGTEGFDKAEVTSGGVPLGALDRVTLESDRVPGLFFCGEVVNVTGRLGGFNFQWAWSSGYAAGMGARQSLAT